MRNIISISLPLPLTNIVDKEVKSGNYASKSEFFRHILRQWMEARTLRELGQSRSELQQGDGKILRSLEDLR